MGEQLKDVYCEKENQIELVKQKDMVIQQLKNTAATLEIDLSSL